MKLKIGTRGSELARTQAELVRQAILRAIPEAEVTLCIISTAGDRVQNKPLSQIGGSGVFVKEIERALLAGEIDLAVHSAKDLPVALGEGLAVSGVLPRGDVRDVLVTRRDAETPQIIGTGSLRRALFIGERFPAAEIRGIRGNVDTRLRKLRDGEYDAVILAAAGLSRLGIAADDALRFETLPVRDMLPAACQGILAVEHRAGDFDAVLRAITNPETHAALETERHVLRLLGGDCSLPVGALAEIAGSSMRLTVTKDCVRILQGEAPVAERLALAERLVAAL